MELAESSRERSNEDSLNPRKEILGSSPDDVANGWLRNPVV